MSNTANKKSGKNKNKNASDTTAEAKDDKVVDTNLENASNEKPDNETNGDATGDDKPDTNTETTAEGEAPAEAKKGKEKAPKKEREKKAPKEKVDAHLAKVEAYGKGLPTPSAAVVELLELARALSTGDMNVLATHIAFDARKRAGELEELDDGGRGRGEALAVGLDLREVGVDLLLGGLLLALLLGGLLLPLLRLRGRLALGRRLGVGVGLVVSRRITVRLVVGLLVRRVLEVGVDDLVVLRLGGRVGRVLVLVLARLLVRGVAHVRSPPGDAGSLPALPIV
jgi:hypothetical protein